MPVSFSDAALKRFTSDLKLKTLATRDALKSDMELYQSYIVWWNGKRRDFLTGIQHYLRDAGIDEPTVLWTGCPAEPGVSFATWDPLLVVDDPRGWSELLRKPTHVVPNRGVIRTVPISNVVSSELYRTALQSPGLNWGGWEIQHAQPADDPVTYQQIPGVLLTHAFNRTYTVADPRTMNDFRGPSGLAMIRHYSLNEHMMFDKNDAQKMNYFICDVERAGPACMMSEVLAMANGDPTMIGYLVGANFGRGFPLHVRRFNCAFLSLPALPGLVDRDASNHSEVVVRRIRTESDGTWLAVINTSPQMQSTTIKSGLTNLIDAATRLVIPNSDGSATLNLEPYSLRALHGN